MSAPNNAAPFSWPQVYVGIALTTLATIILELSLTRIFSVVFHYHFAFLAISIALFGLGAGGLFSYLFRGRSQGLFYKLGILTTINSGAVVLTLVYVLTRRGELDGGTLALVYLASALPFFLAGTVIATTIAETVERVGRVYFFDLIGAAAGCLFLVPLLDLIGGPNTVIGSGVLFASASAIWFTIAGSLRGRVVGVALALALVGLIVLNLKQSVIDVRYAKGEALLEERFVKWNSFSRVALVDEDDGRTSIYIDGGGAAPITDFRPGEQARNEELLAGAAGLPFTLRKAPRTLVIGAGGGGDVARAVAAGSRAVTGVEINPIIANTVMRERFAPISSELYSRPEVSIVVGDGRSFILRTQDQFDILKVPVSSSWEAANAGALALSESNLYTSEAFADYLSRLSVNGIMVFTQWSFDPPRESLRLVALAMEALAALGENDPAEQIAVIRDLSGVRPMDHILVCRSSFSETDLAAIRDAASANETSIVYFPGEHGDSQFAALLSSSDPLEFLASYPFDVGPVDDNRPFFFYTAKAKDLLGFLQNGGDESGMNRAIPMLFRLVGVSLLATAIVLTLPPIFLRSRLPKDRGVIRFLWYFVFIGVGYVLIQVALIQKFVLFLENPTYALTVIIFSLLVSSGWGSFYSRRILGDSDRSLTGALATISLLVALLAVLLPPLTTNGAGWPLPLKVALTVLLIAPTGFVMGMAFPAGLARLGSRHRPSVRWAWSLNSAASVLGSASAVFIGIHLGLRETLLFGGVMYLCALMSIGNRRLSTDPASES